MNRRLKPVSDSRLRVLSRGESVQALPELAFSYTNKMKTQAELALIQQPNGSELMPEVVNGKVDARAVHEALEVSSQFDKWFERRVAEFGFVEGEDFQSFVTKSPLGRPRTDFVVSLDMAKELAMVERNEMGRKMRRYFIECEKRVQASAPVAALGGIPHGTLLKLQEINAGVIGVLGEHSGRIQALESLMRPGPDWLSIGAYLEAHPEAAAALPPYRIGTIQHRSLFSVLANHARTYSEKTGLALGTTRSKDRKRMIRSYAPAAIAAAVEQKLASQKGGTAQ